MPTPTRKPRVYFETNVTPLYSANPHHKPGAPDPDRNGRYTNERNPDANEYAAKCGFTAAMIVGNGQLNRSRLWYDYDAGDWEPTCVPGTGGYGWSMDFAKEGNYSDPVDPRAVAAACRLAREPGRFGATVKPFRPIWTDIENTTTYNAEFTTPAAAVATARAWLAMARTFRQRANQNTDLDLWTFGGHLWLYYADQMEPNTMALRVLDKQAAYSDLDVSDEFAAVEAEHARQYSGFTAVCYNNNLPQATDGEAWYSSLDRQAMLCRRYYPTLYDNRVAFVSPIYLTMWTNAANTTDAMRANNGKPVPIKLWQDQIDYAVARGWDLFCWAPVWDLPGVKEHLDHLKKYV